MYPIINNQMKCLFLYLIFSVSVIGQTNEIDLFKEAIISFNVKNQKSLAIKNAGNYSALEYNYYKLIFNGIPKNAIIISNSKNDTYPLRILQLTKNIRKDVTVICLAFLNEQKYLNQINKHFKLTLTPSDLKVLIKIISQKYSNTFISTTVNTKYFYSGQYFLNGITVGMKNENMISNLKNFYSQYKKLKLDSVVLSKKEELLIGNLLPPLLTLYKLKGAVSQSQLKQDIIKLSKILNKELQIQKILKVYE